MLWRNMYLSVKLVAALMATPLANSTFTYTKPELEEAGYSSNRPSWPDMGTQPSDPFWTDIAEPQSLLQAQKE